MDKERRHFTIPATFVLALFAFVFFGIPHSKAPAIPLVSPKPPTSTKEELPRSAVPIEIDPGEPNNETSQNNAHSGGSSAPTLPDQIYPPGPRSFTIDRQSIRPERPGCDVDRIPLNYRPGSGNGGGEGIGGKSSIVLPDDLDKPPRARFQGAPEYPYQQKSQGITGMVVVDFVVSKSGAVLDPRVISSTHPAFEKPTLQAVAKWRFEPGRRNGQIVSYRMRVPVDFSLNE